jgi:hypothetical protein
MTTRGPSRSPGAPDSQSAPPAGPVTAADISAFLHHLARLRSPAGPGNHEEQAQRADVLAHKAELFDRIAQQHTTTDPEQATHARQIADRARAASAHHAAQLHPRSPMPPTR